MILAQHLPGSWKDARETLGSYADGLPPESVLKSWRDAGRPAIFLACLSISRLGVSQFAGWHRHQPTPRTHPTSQTTPPTCQPDPFGRLYGRTQLACRLSSRPPGVLELLCPYLSALSFSQRRDTKTPSWKLGERRKGGLRSGIPCPWVTWLTIVGSDPKTQVGHWEGGGAVLLPRGRKTRFRSPDNSLLSSHQGSVFPSGNRTKNSLMNSLKYCL